jgi:starvation-inducible DNA-binding protein
MMKTMTAMKNDESKLEIKPDSREPLVKLMQPLLASLQDFQSQVRFCHWNLKGPQFIALHKHFDDLYALVDTMIDDMGERIITIGGIARGLLRDALEMTRLKEPKYSGFTAQIMVPVLADACATVANECRSAIAKANDYDDALTVDLLTQTARELEKQHFLLASNEG